MAKVTATKRKGRVEAAGRKYQGKKANEDKKAKRSKKSIVAEAADSSQGASQSISPSKDQGPLVYDCAMCLFHTLDEDEFIYHNKTDHRSKTFLFCKHCGKCFSNTDALVSHIKKRACSQEDMIFKCGVKDCTFETSSGQLLVFHLQFCRRNVSFIYCVHCEKRFTVPHCLVLHMQECLVKEDKGNPSGHVSETAGAAPVTPKPAPVQLPTERHRRGCRGSGTKASTPRKTAARSRGRGKGRPIANSSNSNADGPSRLSKENAKQTLRRSGRLARK